MLKTVVIAKNPLEPDTWEEFETEDVRELLMREFPFGWPAWAKLYHREVAECYEVTPQDAAGVEYLGTLPGPFFIVVYPGYGAIPYIIAIVVAAIVAYAVASNLPLPDPAAPQSTPSPNNDLADRQNRARPFARIPDIYGTVRSTPDLIMLPYSEYIDNVEYEHAYMCIGRGQFAILDCCDDTTPIDQIEGSRVSVYGPNDSPNRHNFPTVPAPGYYPGHYQFGSSTGIEYVFNAERMTSVNGQDLLTDSTSETVGSVSTMTFTMAPDPTTDATITFSGGEDLSSAAPGQRIYVYVKSYKTHHTTHDTYLSGNFLVRSCTSTTIVLADVQSVANDWGWLQDWPSEFVVTECHVVLQNALRVGPFLLNSPDQQQVWCNLVALNGMYQVDSGGIVTPVNAGLKAIILPTDVNGVATGDPYELTMTLNGDARKNTVATTWKINLDTAGPCMVTLIRTTSSPINSQVSDSIKWRDLLSMTFISDPSFGDITTCYSITKATSGALAVKERKLNLLVQRMLPHWNSGAETFTTDLYPTNNVADILSAIALDQRIGNRLQSELDVQNFYDTATTIGTYFGTDSAAQFCGTFDSDNLSYEETVATVAAAVFCVAYRQGRVMRLQFERQTADSKMLFGHRNKLPGSEQRTLTFGTQNNYDSVEYTYVSPDDDSFVTLYIPAQGLNPKQIKSVGVRSYPQAYFHAWREWYKVRYGNLVTEFEATQEAQLCLRTDCILVADNTRSGSQEGEVVAQNVLELQLSQKTIFEDGKSYHIFLQNVDGAVESIGVHPGSNAYNVLLDVAPTGALSLDVEASYRSLYWIVADDDVRQQAFLVTNREPGSGTFTHKLTAVNYTDTYYAKDKDVVLGIIPDDPDASAIGKKHILPVVSGGSTA